jgi:peptide deformylase
MTARPILVWPDPELLKVSTPVADVDDEVKALVRDMEDTLLATNNGIGLAAHQIGVHKRVIITEVDGAPVVMINPHVTKFGKMVEGEEGCLSVPGFTGMVKRYESCSVMYMGMDGVVTAKELHGHNAVVIQHEYDHLDGVIYVDYLTRTKREFIRKKLLKAKGAR